MTRLYRPRWVAWASLLVASVSGAQSTAEMAAMRKDIEVQRGTVEQKHLADKTACYQQFAVNDCLLQARTRYGAALAELKRQDVLLNDEDRKRRAAAQVRKIEERSSADTQEAASRQRASRVDAATAAQQRQAERQATVPSPDGAKAIPLPDRPRSERPVASPPKTLPPRLVASPDAGQSLQGFNRKQQDAAARKADVDRSRRERSQPLAQPLPPAGSEPTPLAEQLVAPR